MSQIRWLGLEKVWWLSQHYSHKENWGKISDFLESRIVCAFLSPLYQSNTLPLCLTLPLICKLERKAEKSAHLGGFPLGSLVKNPSTNPGDMGDGNVDLIPGSGRSPGGEHGNHSSILAWRIPWIEDPGLVIIFVAIPKLYPYKLTKKEFPNSLQNFSLDIHYIFLNVSLYLIFFNKH